MPLIFAKIGDELEVKRVGGTPILKNIWRIWGLFPALYR